MSQWFHYGEDPFGFKVHETAVGSIHHHLFHLKLDLDIGGRNNSLVVQVNRYLYLHLPLKWPEEKDPQK